METDIEKMGSTVADVARVKAVIVSDKAEETLKLVRALIEEGAQVSVDIHYAEERAPIEDVELVDIGKSDWRQSLRVPRALSLEERNKYIRERAVGAAEAFAAAMTAASGGMAGMDAPKSKKGA